MNSDDTPDANFQDMYEHLCEPLATQAGGRYWVRRVHDVELAISASFLASCVESALVDRSKMAANLRLGATELRRIVGVVVDEEEYERLKVSLATGDTNLLGPKDRVRLELTQRVVTAFTPLANEVCFCRSVDNFLTYLTEIMTEVVQKKPEVLRSRQEVTLEQVLAHTSMMEFVESLAESTISQLAMSGIKELAKFARSRLGIDLIDDSDLQRRVGIAIAARNVFVHRRGIVDERFLVAAGGTEFGEKGKLLDINKLRTQGVYDCMHRVVAAVDQKIAEKFDLEFYDYDKPESWSVHILETAAAMTDDP